MRRPTAELTAKQGDKSSKVTFKMVSRENFVPNYFLGWQCWSLGKGKLKKLLEYLVHYKDSVLVK